MSRQRTRWNDPAEHEVLVKLYHGYRLTRKDHFILAKIYEVHGPSSVYMAMGNLSGSLQNIGKGLAQASAEDGSRKKPKVRS